MELQGLHVSIAAIVSIVALAQFMILAAVSAFSRKVEETKGLRTTDFALMGSAAVFVIALTLAHVSSAPKNAAVVAAASTVASPSSPRGSCNSINRDMARDQVEQNLGKADEVRSDEENRGPGAVVWIYRGSRCAVHIFDDKVEFVE